MNRLFVPTTAVLLSLTLAPRLAAQRDLFGMGGSAASEVRRQFEAEARSQVSALLLDYQSAWGSRNLAALAKLYAADAALYPAAGPLVSGRDAVREWFRGFLPRAEPLQARMMEFRVSGDLAYATLQVAYVLHDGDAARPVTATDVVVLRRSVVGAWSIVSHLSRPEAPPRAADSAQ